MVDQIRFFAGAARVLEGASAGEYMAGHTSFIRREPVGVCAAGDAVELPDDDGGLEVGAGASRPATPWCSSRRTPRPVSTLLMAEIMAEFLPPGRLQRRLRRPRHRPGARGAPDAADGVDHRQRPGRHGSRQAAAAAGPEAGAPRARRQGAGHRVRRRRPGKGGGGDRRSPATSTPGRTARRPPGCSPGLAIHDDFVAALTEQAKGTVTGGPKNEDALYGPLNNAAQLARVSGLLRAAARPRARC